MLGGGGGCTQYCEETRGPSEPRFTVLLSDGCFGCFGYFEHSIRRLLPHTSFPLSQVLCMYSVPYLGAELLGRTP